MKKYNLINNVFGWFSFVLAATVYLMTIEPTASFWDCGEFIASAYKLEVGHPPGAPFFMLTGKFFSLFASGPTQVAMMVNAMSAILSALTILFLFWTITHLVKKLVVNGDEKNMSMGQLIIIMGSGLVGALTYTFTDTFWFSAVEGEVYAYSSMFTALVFWLILKWENRADQAGSDKWLVVLAYTMGLSIGVHLLNLLCIPAIVLVYYYKKNENANVKGTLMALAGSFALIVILMYGIIPGFTKVGGWFELFFINELGFSYNTGVLIYILILVLTLAWALYETLAEKGSLKKAKIALVICLALSGVTFIGSSVLLWMILLGGLIGGVVLYKGVTARLINTTVLCLFVILVGYSSFALIPIRSVANTPMDQNSPENVFTLASYLNREQYGDRPLFFGKTYASDVARDAAGKPVKSSEKDNYDKVAKMSPDEKDRYVVVATAPTYEYTNSMLFPRMHSGDELRHTNGYRAWAGVKDLSVAPTMLENMRFFFSYQLNFMYFRYFMWNFSGRQNDIQGYGDIGNGNWITGISFVDEYLLGRGPQDNLPPSITENKGHNTYYALPFILGILGVIFQLTRKRKGEQQFLVTFLLFFMTGIAIILYLNQQPQEPRERDYAYAGSFYAYCIWIGIGVAFIWNLLKKALDETTSSIIATGLALCIPIQMASQNWDDHDRSDRYTMRDFGQNYLAGCPPNSILFTMGDNDTFPLWYAQEVEGYRTDVRVCNLSYLQTDWYVDQMRRQAYESEALPITWTEDRYQGMKGMSAYVFSNKDFNREIQKDLQRAQQDGKSMIPLGGINYGEYYDTNVFKESMPLDDALEILKTKDNYTPRNIYNISSGVIVPSTKFTVPVDSANVDWKNLGTKPSSEFTIDLGDNKFSIYRQEIMIMEMLNNISKEDWKRPIYYAVTIGQYPLNLRNQLMLEGINYRIVPGQLDGTRVNTEVMFDNLMNKYKWGGAENPKVYMDENNTRMATTFRLMFSQLITALLEEGDKDKALQALDRCVEALPGTTIPRKGESLILADAYYELGKTEKARAIVDEILYRCEGDLQWFARFDQYEMMLASGDIREQLDLLYRVLDVYQRNEDSRYEALLEKTNKYLETFLVNRVQFDPNNHPLDMLMKIAMRGYHLNEDTLSATRENSAEMMQKASQLMQQYQPNLLKKYFDYNEQ